MKVRKMVKYILCLLFILFAAVQVNDPDPWLWVLLYAAVAVNCWFAARSKMISWLFFLTTAGVILWMILLWPEFNNWIKMGTPSIAESMKAEKPHIEFAREFLGLLLSLATLVYLWISRAK